MILKNATVLNGDFNFEKKDIQITGEIITDIADNLTGENQIDCRGLMILPGAVDIHTHGAVGYDHCTGDTEGLSRVCEYEASCGVTSFVPTTMTVSEQMLTNAVRAVADYQKQNRRGASVLGVHLEGPFFSMEKRGAQPAEYIHKPDIEMLERINAASGGIVKIVDVAPETEGALEFICRASKICRVSIGHTAADYETTKKGFENGASHAVHLYNGMTGANHREPGVVGAVWDSENATAELICDGIHIHPAIIRTTFKILDGRVVMISDSLSGAGLSEGESFNDAAGHKITVSGGKATLDDGTIAGSTTNLFECVRRVVGFGLPLETAMRAASLMPAKVVGMDDIIGSIEVGKRADLVVVDKDLDIKAVYTRGQKF